MRKSSKRWSTRARCLLQQKRSGCGTGSFTGAAHGSNIYAGCWRPLCDEGGSFPGVTGVRYFLGCWLLFPHVPTE